MKKIYLFLLIIFLFQFQINAQTIDQSKKELNDKNSKNKSNSNNSSTFQPDNPLKFFEILGYVTFGVIKYGVVGDYKNEIHLKNNLNLHPFSLHGRGNYSESDSLKPKNFRVDLENQFLNAGNSFYGNHLDVKIRPSKYFYFETDYYELFDKNLFSSQTDQLSLFFFTFAYDRVRLENFNLGWTFGASYVGTEVNKSGFSMGVNAEYFLKQNISISVDSKWSTINEKPVNSFQIKGKYFRKRFFGSLSYDRLKIATPVYNFIGLGGGVYF